MIQEDSTQRRHLSIQCQGGQVVLDNCTRDDHAKNFSGFSRLLPTKHAYSLINAARIMPPVYENREDLL